MENVIERGIILTEHNHVIEAQNLFPHFTPGLDYFSIAGEALLASVNTNSKDAYISQLLENGFDLETGLPIFCGKLYAAVVAIFPKPREN